ncbi:hypothetical protein H2248_002783 [Termitomyces sp. 'cryptogamus']|nr:hypothetical protein H2248_002783 [Termitomyces sp. 'cryptogamus']
MINALYSDLSVHVTVEFRVFPSIGKTIQYAKMLDLTGAQIITCHGRTHEQRGKKYCESMAELFPFLYSVLTPNQGLASYAHVAAVKRAVSIPVFANGKQPTYNAA